MNTQIRLNSPQLFDSNHNDDYPKTIHLWEYQGKKFDAKFFSSPSKRLFRIHFSVADNSLLCEQFRKQKQTLKTEKFLESFYDTPTKTLLKNDAFFIERFNYETLKSEYKLKIKTKREKEMVSYTEITDIPGIIEYLKTDLKVDVADERSLMNELVVPLFGFVTKRFYLENDLFYDFSTWEVFGTKRFFIVGTKELTSFSPSETLTPSLSKTLTCLYSTVPALMKPQLSKGLLELNPPIDPSIESEQLKFFKESEN